MAEVIGAVVRQRLTGYRDAWTEGGLSPEDLGVVECGANDPAARRAVRGPLSRRGPRPTALELPTRLVVRSSTAAAPEAE
ncbi:hypothetical protein ACF1BU_03760 [Streptomyces sp. NPDC014724]|uniref:hypothetical protein n=1 Tax=unclassified Streptomyces TaxID=2593676 RepID=UPI0036F980A8